MFDSNSNQAKVNYNSNSNSTKSKWVINLSSHPLTQAQVSFLSKGPNFAFAPNSSPSVEFISAIELACQKLTEQDAQEHGAEVNIMLRKAKPPKSNISREEKKALKELREDQDRMVLTADKGVALVSWTERSIRKNRRLTGNTSFQKHQGRSHKQIEGTTQLEAQKNKKGN